MPGSGTVDGVPDAKPVFGEQFEPEAVQKWMATPVNSLAVRLVPVSTNVTVSALTTPFGCPLTLVKSKAKVPKTLMFWLVLRCWKFRPLYVLDPAVAAKLLTPASVRPEAPLKAKSPPFNFTEKPDIMAMLTVT